MEKRLEQSCILKIVSYILLFIFVILTGYSALGYIAYKEMPEIATDKPYYETVAFADTFKSQMEINVSRLNSFIIDYKDRNENPENYTYDSSSIEQYSYFKAQKNAYIEKINNGEILYESLYSNMGASFKYLIIKDNLKITNIIQTGETDTVEKLINHIKKDNYYWSYKKGNVETNISNLEKEKIIYDSQIQDIIEGEYEVYFSYSPNTTEYTVFERNNAIYELVQRHYIGYEMLPLYLFFSIILFVYLTISMGHSKQTEEIKLNFLDKVSLEILIAIFGLAIFFEILSLYVMFIDISQIMYERITIPVISILSIIAMIYITAMIAYSSIIRRIKANVLLKNTLIYKICSFLKRIIWGNIKKFMEKISSNWRLTIYYFGFCIISVILFLMGLDNGFFLLLLVIWGIWVFIKITEHLKQMKKLRDMINRIYDGKTDILLDVNEFKGNLKNVAKYLNDIAGGFSNAIEENLKSERMKTELITNVSHDLKTPLTSIINYVDLLKSENIENEKAKEYIEVLDNKSQRLKKLTEDLVEASKASSGNIKLNMENLNVKELINQVTGEFEDKFEQKKLTPIISFPEKNVVIKADSRYLYRVLENVYSNISKYAKEDTRVYIDIIKNNKKVLIAIKNISKEQLNISADELMQRFVRGDSSRNTEGSGLGLSIANSLTELQGGTFNIYLDGDLFKVVIEFPIILEGIEESDM